MNILNTILRFLEDHTPVWCAVCGFVTFRKNIHFVRLTTGRSVPICPYCYKEHFTPFSG